ncbi:hypothetical protein T11_15531 [Trichinella zimbabwensis]|uniref:Uncharacterized protein n=1 Tax=Trichinella zimbabwensis TaxID=268475 RepID=A0A0V1GAH0_9BILA|nr:hypothetical protein T11_15531 [Trichinella zimbabwensis]
METCNLLQLTHKECHSKVRKSQSFVSNACVVVEKKNSEISKIVKILKNPNF